MKITTRFVGGPSDGKTIDVAPNIRTVTVPGDARGRGFVKGTHGFGEFVYRLQPLVSGERVLIPRDLDATDSLGNA